MITVVVFHVFHNPNGRNTSRKDEKLGEDVDEEGGEKSVYGKWI